MPIPEHFLKALRNEFTAFYDVSELPDSWDEWMSELDQEAAASATRLRGWIDNDAHASDLAGYLRDQSRERRGDLVLDVENWTRFGWSDEEEDWIALQRILRAIADRLDAEPKAEET